MQDRAADNRSWGEQNLTNVARSYRETIIAVIVGEFDCMHVRKR